MDFNMLNKNYRSLNENYLFSDIARRVADFTAKNPDRKIIRMGIGDVILPLSPAVTAALQGASVEMGTAQGFHGYGPEQGYGFLREAVAGYYKKRGVTLDTTEIFISDGAKSDCGNITDLFSDDVKILVPDPTYPVYVDSNLMLGRDLDYLNASPENGFLPMPDDDTQADIVYLCSPNNPTGAVYTRGQLEEWVNWANNNRAVILFDAAYEAFIRDPALPRSIFEIEGARTCAVELCSLSKTAGFTGTRCGYTVIPHDLEREGMSINKMWLRRQTTKFNGVPYIIQRGAEAVFTDEGQRQIQNNIDYYMDNAGIITRTMKEKGIDFTGGENSPYIWIKCGMNSWEFFDRLLKEAAVVGTPGAGFGNNGEGFFRFTSFGSRESTQEAMRRFAEIF